jgi:Pyridoxamine 5'-phosphate oxidase
MHAEPHAELLNAPHQYGFPRSIRELLPWSHAETRLVSARAYWLATTAPNGCPHVTPVWGVWLDRYLFFDGLPTTRWARNLTAHPSASINLASTAEVVVVTGVVDDFQADPIMSQRIVAAWTVKYATLVPDPAGDGVFRFTARLARGWSNERLGDGTRWVLHR